MVSGSGSGWVGVLKYTIKFFWGYFFCSQVFLGDSGYSLIFPGIFGFIGYHLFFGHSELNV